MMDETGTVRLEPTTEKGRTQARACGDRLLVGVRVRPPKEAKTCVTGNSDDNYIVAEDPKGGGRKREYSYDYVFTSGQDEVYDCIGRPMLEQAMKGFNVCLFAYGQTGSGKTYTIQGLPGAGLEDGAAYNPDLEGISPRLCRDLFSIIEEKLDTDSTLTIKTTLSLIEVYNEKVRDMLPPKPTPEPPSLEIHETADRKIEVKGLTKHTILSCDKLIALLKQGTSNRKKAATEMNPDSSRSHLIMQLHVVQQHERADVRDCESTITIVDLAGSERQKKSQTAGEQFEEAKNINYSLLCLGRVLNSFADKKKGAEVRADGLRDSKLTRLLSDSFGGNSKTWMLATVSPDESNFSETASTLSYASNAKLITNNAKQNSIARAMELQELKDRNSALQAAYDMEKQRVLKLEQEAIRLRQRNSELRETSDPKLLKRLKEENDARMREAQTLEQDVEVLRAQVDNDMQKQKELNELENEKHRAMKELEELRSKILKTPAAPAEEGVYIGRARVSLRNIIDQTSAYLTLPLQNDSCPVTTGAIPVLVVSIYPVDHRGTAALDSNRGPTTGKDLLGQRVDFVVHVIGAKNIPHRFSGKVYCQYVYKWAERDSYQTPVVMGTTDPDFDYKKRFAFSKMNAGLVDYFRSEHVITFEVIGQRLTQ